MAAALHQPKHRRPQARHLFTARVFTARRQPDAVKRHVTGERSVIGPPTCIGELEISREVSLINDDYRSFIRERACSGAVSSRGGVSSAVAASAARRGAVASAAAPSSAACEWNHINHRHLYASAAAPPPPPPPPAPPLALWPRAAPAAATPRTARRPVTNHQKSSARQFITDWPSCNAGKSAAGLGEKVRRVRRESGEALRDPSLIHQGVN